MKPEIIRVDPISLYLEQHGFPTAAATRHGSLVYVSGLPPFDLESGRVLDGTIEDQTEAVMQQMKLCLEAAGSSLENVLKCNVYCLSVEKFTTVNTVYRRYFSKDPPARTFVCVAAWPGRFEIEIDCIAVAE